VFYEVHQLEWFQTPKVTFRVIQGHWQWSHIRFPVSRPLQLCLSCIDSKILLLISPKSNEDTWPWTHLFCIHKYSCVSSSSQNFKCLASPIPEIGLGAKFKEKMAMWPWPLGDILLPKARTWYILLAYKILRLLLQPFQRWLWARKLKMGHVTLTTPLSGMACHQ